VAYRYVRLISEAAASVGFAAAGQDDAMARLLSRSNIEEYAADPIRLSMRILRCRGMRT
jgi:hypothetical protein